MNPLVSIITPSYNQAAYLEDTIRSVLSQDYSPIEYLIVDGGSTDGSVELIRRYAKQLTMWISEPDSGQAEAINKGFHNAQGEIVAWLNSDDILLPGAVSQAVANLQAEPDLGMVFGEALTIDAMGRPLKQLAFGQWGLEQLVAFRIICQPAVFMRRTALEKAGFLESSYHYMLDHHLWIRVARLAPIRYAGSQKENQQIRNMPWAAARQHPGAKNVSQSLGFCQETMRLFAWMQTQPDLVEIIQHDRRGVVAGAHRLNARYLLDGGKYLEALKSYGRAVLAHPAYAMKHWHRMLFAGLAWVGLKPFLESIRSPLNMRRQKQLVQELLSSDLNRSGKLEDWPGLRLSKDSNNFTEHKNDRRL